jgi:hypothetical protein
MYLEAPAGSVSEADQGAILDCDELKALADPNA